MSEPDAALGSPEDAGDLRGYYFRRLLGRSSTLTLAALGAIAAGIAGTVLGGPRPGAFGFFGGLALAIALVFIVARSRSEEAFFGAYAKQRQMVDSGSRQLPPATPLLRKGDSRSADRVLEGPLGDGVEGLLALYTYEEESSDGQGGTQTNRYRYTVSIALVPECAELLPDLICHRRSGPRSLERLEDVFRTRQRVEFESEALADRYEVFAGRGQDQNRLRQLFSPTFIVWLTESAPKKFGFELVCGELCCFVSGHRKDAADLDAMRGAAATIATRLREEAEEEGPQRPPHRHDAQMIDS